MITELKVFCQSQMKPLKSHFFLSIIKIEVVKEKNNNHKVSVIVPVYNEPTVLRNVKTIEKELKKAFSDYEIICVDDGSRDQTSSRLRSCKSSKIKLISYPLHIGKGFALCHGFSQSSGDLVAFLDGDLDIHPKQLRLFVDLMDLVDADIVIGSKYHPLSKVNLSSLRRLYSRIYQLLIRILFRLNVSDTQVGLKLFKRKVLEKVIPRIIVKAWAFDLEVLVVAHHLGFKRIIEAPIELNMRPFGSKIDLGAVRNILQDTAAIFYRRYLLRFYDRKITPANRRRYQAKPKKASTGK